MRLPNAGSTIRVARAALVITALAAVAPSQADPGVDPGVGPGVGQSTRAAGSRPSAPSSAVAVSHRQWIQIRNTDLRMSDSVVVRIQQLEGEVLRTAPGHPATLDDPKSYRIRVTAGRVALTGSDLGGILNSIVFGYPGAPLRDLAVRTDGNEIVQTGVMHKGVDFRFRLRGTLSLMPDGRVRIHPSQVRVLGLNGEKVLHLFGLHLDNLLDLSKAHGATVKGDDLFLDPISILPPPAIDGRLATIAVDGPRIAEDFVRLPDDSVFGGFVRADTAFHNFVYFRGGELQFGKLLMSNTDLRIVDADPRTPFDLNLPHYTSQLVAGTSHTLRNQGLLVYMPDFSRLGAAPAGGPTASDRKSR